MGLILLRRVMDSNTLELCLIVPWLVKHNAISHFPIDNNNNNNNANICIARLKQNSSGALMAQTNTLSVFVQMTTVTASGVADRPEDCSKLCDCMFSCT